MSDAATTHTQRTQLPKFSGKEDYEKWHRNLQAYAYNLGLDELIDMDPSIETPKEMEKQDKELWCAVQLSCIEEASNIVDTVDVKKGRKAIAALRERYLPTRLHQQTSCAEKIFNLKLTTNDTEQLMNELEKESAKLDGWGLTLPEMFKTMFLLQALPAAYDDLRKHIMMSASYDEQALKIDRVKKQIRDYTDELKKNKKTNNEPDLAMFAKQKGSGKGVTCYKCKKTGHMAHECRGSMYCQHCKRTGHDTSKCWHAGEKGSGKGTGKDDQAAVACQLCEAADHRAPTCPHRGIMTM